MSFLARLYRFWHAAGPVRRLLVLGVVATLCYATYASLAENPVAPQAWDKGVHFVGYFGLMLMAGLALVLPRRVLPAALVLLAYSGAIEILQTQTETRLGEFGDFLANGLGIVAALLVLAALQLMAGWARRLATGAAGRSGP
ncbi:VanZ family protein [Zavarzinia sp. CC-PAN008]|uniref:VanZ family protein n=1 Tax=Zavarzinia sp. CC-PAN008 TaxID=3243332 RepID=UPI003F746F21